MADRVALVLSGLGHDTGCALRARYLGKGLAAAGWKVVQPRPCLPNLPWSLEALALAPWHLWLCLLHRPALAVGVKPYPSTWLALAASRLWGCVAVVDVDDLDGAWRGGLLGRLSSLIQAPAYLLLNRFSSHHDGILDWLRQVQRIPEDRLVRLAQGVDTALFHPAGAGDTLPPDPAVAGRRVLLHPAHLNVASEAPLLLDWLSNWLKQRPDCVLVIAGGGPRSAELKAHAEALGLGGHVLFTGLLEPGQVAAWMRCAEFLLAPYQDREANRFRVPMKVLEGLACDLRVLCQMIPGLEPFRSGLYPAGKGREAFLAALTQALESPGDGREKSMGRQVRMELDWDQVASTFLSTLGL